MIIQECGNMEIRWTALNTNRYFREYVFLNFPTQLHGSIGGLASRDSHNFYTTRINSTLVSLNRAYFHVCV